MNPCVKYLEGSLKLIQPLYDSINNLLNKII